jgi:endonuclease/exonuclease/phosphatase family metal-dependent hydrolase
MKTTRRIAAALLALGGLGAAGGFAASATAAPGPARAGTHALTVVTYNVGDPSDRKVRADLARLAERRPEVICLQEVADRDELLRRVAPGLGYRLYQPSAGEASRHNAILVHRDVKLIGQNILRISDRTYVGHTTAGARTTGYTAAKYISLVRVQADGRGWVVGNVHLVPSAEREGNTRTRALHHRQTERAAEWFTNRALEPVLVGDFNAEPDSPLLTPLRKVAKASGEDSHGHRAIDIVWSAKDTRTTTKALRGYSSDHRPVEVTITAR